ncbi:fasciclin domain-containing protein [Luteipulveratus sp. YIM 133132]|uniref:fasciclin domain-containing protein n=1 Tax=Luteipulveratus flavus TaxID=3031728 RepID=UPI0023AFA98F|nr:fasciclin domain-containing protein [Luteipulveratus sp. YIM 133132]MDE9365322.1 fasciclin domain-containing protein [Luteipulveratus sp. YIM 133132]
MKTTRRGLTAALVLSLPLALGACGSSDSGSSSGTPSAAASAAGGSSSGGSSSAGSSSTMGGMGSGSSSSGMSGMSHSGMSHDMGGAAAPFGSGCAAVPRSGKGSFSGMAQDPVATAASNNPALSTLVTAVKKAGLVDTLNNAKDITVLAPTNDAFAKVPKATMDKAMGDPKGLLTTVLTGHVIPGKLSPEQLAGTHKTLSGSMVKITGSGQSFTADGTAKVVCGNVPTANATVYIIDSVLLPKG